MHISVISIPVSDQERARDFYADGVGFAVVADAPFGDGQRWIQLAPPDGDTAITLVTWFDDLKPGSVRGLILDVDDISAAREAMAGRGVPFTEETWTTPWGSFAGFEDPDGNRWSLHQDA
jgi:catechol 2,3-dioxygenase-like lactoylglutathione lyase family enzyme